MGTHDIYLGLGRDLGGGKEWHAWASSVERERHTYIVGSSGSGKTELLKILMQYDIAVGRAGLVVIDAHTDVCEQVAKWPEEALRDRLVYLTPELFPDTVPALNPLQLPKGATNRTKEKIANRLADLIGDICRGNGGGDLSVRMVNVAKACLRVLLDAPGATLKDLRDMMTETPPPALLRSARDHPDMMLREFFRNEWDSGDYEASKAAIRVRLTNLLLHRDFLHITCSTTSTPLYDLVDAGSVVLFSLGRAGSETAQIVGKMVLSMMAVLGDIRKDSDQDDRRPVHVFVDECQNFMGPGVTTILKELRKYGIHLTLANQYITDFSKEERDAVLANTYVKMMGPSDAPGPMLSALGCDDTFGRNVARTLPNRKFLVRWGSEYTFILKARSDLADKNRRVSNSQWIARKLAQRPFYAPAHNLTPEPTPNVSNEAMEGFSRELD
jgi:hypothetical protein